MDINGTGPDLIPHDYISPPPHHLKNSWLITVLLILYPRYCTVRCCPSSLHREAWHQDGRRVSLVVPPTDGDRFLRRRTKTV